MAGKIFNFKQIFRFSVVSFLVPFSFLASFPMQAEQAISKASYASCIADCTPDPGSKGKNSRMEKICKVGETDASCECNVSYPKENTSNCKKATEIDSKSISTVTCSKPPFSTGNSNPRDSIMTNKSTMTANCNNNFIASCACSANGIPSCSCVPKSGGGPMNPGPGAGSSASSTVEKSKGSQPVPSGETQPLINNPNGSAK